MKKTALTMAISSLLLAGGAQAANVYDQNGTKLDIGGLEVGFGPNDHTGLEFVDLSIIDSGGKFRR